MTQAGEELDDIDRVLVRELVADGRATLTHLAESAGLSVSAVQSRVRRLESRGVVTGYRARINPEALGNMLSAFVAITPLDPSQPDDAPARLEHIEAIESCHSVAGEESYVLLVRVRSGACPGGAAAADPHDGERPHPKHHHLTNFLRWTRLHTVNNPSSPPYRP